MTAQAVEPAVTYGASDYTHLTCCDDDTALCGVDVSGEPWTRTKPWCPACLELDLDVAPCTVPGCNG